MSEQHQLYFGGRIYTPENRQPQVEAVAVAGGRILASGTLEKCRSVLALLISPSI